jgi:hypothetical protein
MIADELILNNGDLIPLYGRPSPFRGRIKGKKLS